MATSTRQTVELEISQLNIPQGIIDLGAGQPSPELLPVEIVRQTAISCTAAMDPAHLAYGYAQGHGQLREALAQFLDAEYGFPVKRADLLITAGASQALDLLCTHFTQPGDTILVEAPTYFLALRIFADHGLNVVAVPMDDNGLQVDKLEQVLGQTNPKLLYTIPTFHNPAGITLPQSRREALIQLSRQHGFLIIADEVYHLLNYGGPLPPPLACQPRNDRVLSIGSFSKILAPGLRLGWIQASEKYIQHLADCGLLDSGGGMNPFTALVVQHILKSGDQAAQLDLLKQTYRARMFALDKALSTYLGSIIKYQASPGGYFRWVRFPRDSDTAILRSMAIEKGVSFQPGKNFYPDTPFTNHLRLSWAYYRNSDLDEGINRLSQVIN